MWPIIAMYDVYAGVCIYVYNKWRVSSYVDRFPCIQNPQTSGGE